MYIWLLLFGAFLIQEPISSNTILLAAYQSHYNVWLIHLLFIAATVLDIFIGYGVGMFFYKRHSNGKIARYAKKWSDRFASFTGPFAHGFFLFIFAHVSLDNKTQGCILDT